VGGFLQLLPTEPSWRLLSIPPTAVGGFLQLQPDFGPEVNHPPTPVGGIKDFCSLDFIVWI
jgi:hypothetical protein